MKPQMAEADAMENLLDEKAAQRKWDDSDRIGFRIPD
jgi:hypothetical protein